MCTRVWRSPTTNERQQQVLLIVIVTIIIISIIVVVIIIIINVLVVVLVAPSLVRRQTAHKPSNARTTEREALRVDNTRARHPATPTPPSSTGAGSHRMPSEPAQQV